MTTIRKDDIVKLTAVTAVCLLLPANLRENRMSRQLKNAGDVSPIDTTYGKAAIANTSGEK